MVFEKEPAVNEMKKNKQRLFPHQNPSYSRRKSNLLNLRRSKNEWPQQQTNTGDGDETRPESTKGTVYKEVKRRLGDGRLNLSLFRQSIPTGALKTRLPCLRYELRPMAVKKGVGCFILSSFLTFIDFVRVWMFFSPLSDLFVLWTISTLSKLGFLSSYRCEQMGTTGVDQKFSVVKNCFLNLVVPLLNFSLILLPSVTNNLPPYLT